MSFRTARTNKMGAVIATARITSIESLETRRLMAASHLSGNASPYTLLIDGTPGNDVIGVAARGTRLRVAVNGVVTQFRASAVSRIEIQAGDGTDVVDASGTAINTYVLGGLGNDLIRGGAGDDTLTGAGGKDTLYGNAGNDRLNGGASNDIIFGGDGNDAVYGGDGADSISADAGNDHLFGDAGIDTMLGGDGNDVFESVDGGVDYVVGGAGKNVATTDVTGDTTKTIRTVTTAVYTPPDSGGGSTGGGDNTGNGSGGPVSTGSHPLAISVNDESLWDQNFSTTISQLHTLGVTVVRLFVSINSYADRPHAYDNINYADIVGSWNGSGHPLIAGLAMKRAFALKRAGFKVLLTIQETDGHVPASDQVVTDFYTYMMNATETSGGSTKLKDVVDYWEVGNEVDLSAYWAPSGTNKAAGLKQYVDDLLIPAAAALHSGPNTKWEQIVSASVSYNPKDMNAILTELKALGRTNAIDEIGYHPYGRYLPAQNIDEITPRVTQAAAYAAAFGKPLIATEWNVRGYANNGSQNTSWSSAISTIYNNDIKPNFLIGFYFALTNNFAGRGGSNDITARPAGLLTHDYNGSVTQNSSASDLLAYYKSPLVPSDPFYSVYNAFTT